MKKLRILLVDLWEGPGHAYYSGPLVSALTEREELEVGLLYNIDQDLTHYTGKFERIPVAAPLGVRRDQGMRLVKQPWEILKTWKRIQRFAPDLIHIVFAYPWFSALAPFISARYSMVSTLHDITPHPGERTLRNWLGIYSSLLFSKQLFVHGPSSLEEAVKYYPRYAAKFVSIPHGNFDFLLHDLSARNPDRFLFLLFGRQLPYKGSSIALMAIAEVALEFPNIRLIVCGDGKVGGPQLKKMVSQGLVEVRNWKHSLVELTGLFNGANAALLPYLHASGSGVAALSYALACPIIGSNIGGLGDMIVHQKTGLKVIPGDPQSLSDALKFAIRNPCVMAEFGKSGNEYARQHWGWDKIATRLYKVYRDTLA